MVSKIKKCCTEKKRPDGSPYQSLSVKDTSQLAMLFATSGRHIEIAALEQEIIPERYARNFITFSFDDQIKLLEARVGVVGLGGLGGGVAELLARAGVGMLSLVDGDNFEDSNLNRQLFSRVDLLDNSKARAARERIGKINPSVEVHEHALFLDKKNASVLMDSWDVAVDCLDNVPTRFILENETKTSGIPLVTAAVAGLSGQVTTIFPGDKGMQLFYGDPEKLPPRGVEAILGTLPPVVTLFSTLECSEVIKIILGKKNILRNRLLVVDLTDNTFESIKLES
jgi:molybdopterin-synthase adenylyltransferase